MAGGPQGSGVDTAATIFSRACGYGGLHLYGKREYHSNIKGLHSYFHIRVSPREVLANVNGVDLLAAFDHETVARHFDEVSPGGGLILDAEGIEKSVFDIPTLPKEFKEELKAQLKDRGIGGTVQDLIEEVERKGGKIFRVSYMELLRKVSESLGVGLTRVMPMLNVLSIGISFSLLRYDISLVEKAVMSTFSSRPKIAEMNILALREAYKYAEEAFPEGLGFSLEKVGPSEERIVLQGHQAIALGKILGGCRMQIYYPITPLGMRAGFSNPTKSLRPSMGRVPS